MKTVPIDIRRPRAGDAAALAELYAEAWRYAYRGILPGVALERMVARRGPRWWGRAQRHGMNVLMLCFDGKAAGYATFGRSRGALHLARGEIYEIYLRPEYHGAGMGRRLFTAARRALAVRGPGSLIVWSLADNPDACRFYTAMGGRLRAEAIREIGGVPLRLLGYVWA